MAQQFKVLPALAEESPVLSTHMAASQESVTSVPEATSPGLLWHQACNGARTYIRPKHPYSKIKKINI